MRRYFKRLWRTRRGYITVLIGLSAGTALHIANGDTIATGDMVVGSGGLGIFAGGLLACLLWLAPVAYLDGSGSKVARPRPVFVEPPLYILAPLMVLAGTAVVLIAMMPLFLSASLDRAFTAQLDNDTFLAGLVMMSVITTALVGPGSLYTIYIRRHYTRIVEYGTPEWRRRRRRS